MQEEMRERVGLEPHVNAVVLSGSCLCYLYFVSAVLGTVNALRAPLFVYFIFICNKAVSVSVTPTPVFFLPCKYNFEPHYS